MQLVEQHSTLKNHIALPFYKRAADGRADDSLHLSRADIHDQDQLVQMFLKLKEGKQKISGNTNTELQSVWPLRRL